MIKEICSSISSKLKNIPLQQKILLLVFLILVITLSGSVLGFQMIFSSGNRMLYESLAGSLTDSAEAITYNLNSIESMTGIFLADSKIQHNLSVVTDTQNSVSRNGAYRALSYLVPEYYQNFKQYGINYINLYNSDYVTYSDLSKSQKTPDAVHKQLLSDAHTYAGAPIWITAYCNKYGLFLSRDIRRAAQLKLDTLGTIVVSVNLDDIISDSTKNLYRTSSAEYILFKNDQEIYHSASLDNQDLSNLPELAQEKYGVIHFDHRPYFYVRDSIPDYDWDYICLSSYERIEQAQNTYLFISACIILISVTMSLILSRKIILSITIHFVSLIKKMDDFGKDESSLPIADTDYTNRNDEIGELHRRFDLMALKVHDLIQKNYVSELLSKEAQLKALENQINPHFLYNTLESLNWHAKAIGSTEISIMVESLGSLLRTTLNQNDSNSTLEKELKIVDDYMTIIKIRFDERIQYENQISKDFYPLMLPHLTLQPLVENAVNYALEEVADTCTIRITCFMESEQILLYITNSGSQFPPDLLEQLAQNTIQPHGFGIGLLNIHKRLTLRFGIAYGLTLYNEDDDHAVVQITLPKDALPAIPKNVKE